MLVKSNEGQSRMVSYSNFIVKTIFLQVLLYTPMIYFEIEKFNTFHKVLMYSYIVLNMYFYSFYNLFISIIGHPSICPVPEIIIKRNISCLQFHVSQCELTSLKLFS